jgi:hypothetical protein
LGIAVKQAGSIPPIEVKISGIHQLFNSMDPSPFHERDLDDDAEEFIVSWAREYPAKGVIRLVIHLANAPPDTDDPQGLVATSLRHFFEYREGIIRRELKQLLKEGRTALVIGLAFLAACHAAATLFAPDPGTLHGIAREGLAILGWVAMWHPLEILLYLWWPKRQSARLYRRLAEAEIRVKIAG